MKLFNKKEENKKIGRPKLADSNLKKKSIIIIAIMIIIVIGFILGGMFSLNLFPKYNSLKGSMISYDNEGNTYDNGIFLNYKYFFDSHAGESVDEIEIHNESNCDIVITKYADFYDINYVLEIDPVEIKKGEIKTIPVVASEFYLGYKMNNKEFFIPVYIDDREYNSASDYGDSIREEGYAGFSKIPSLSYADSVTNKDELEGSWKTASLETNDVLLSFLGINMLSDTHARTYFINMDISERLEEVRGSHGKYGFISSIHFDYKDIGGRASIYHPQSNKALEYNDDLKNYFDFEPNDEKLEILSSEKNKTKTFYLLGKPKGIYNNQKILFAFYGEIETPEGNLLTLNNGLDLKTEDNSEFLYIILTTYDKSVLKEKIDYHYNRIKNLTSLQMGIEEYIEYENTLELAFKLYNNRDSYCRKIDSYSKCIDTRKVTQEEIDNMISLLDEKAGNVYKKADYSKISSLINKINKLNKEDYTKESWERLEKELSIVNENMELSEIYQKKVDKLTEELSKAFNALVIDKTKTTTKTTMKNSAVKKQEAKVETTTTATTTTSKAKNKVVTTKKENIVKQEENNKKCFLIYIIPVLLILSIFGYLILKRNED